MVQRVARSAWLFGAKRNELDRQSCWLLSRHPGQLQQDRNARRVVLCARRRGHGVEVSAHDDMRLAGIEAGRLRDDVR